nr:unnamed protein product [Digitaria exilis]
MAGRLLDQHWRRGSKARETPPKLSGGRPVVGGGSCGPGHRNTAIYRWPWEWVALHRQIWRAAWEGGAGKAVETQPKLGCGRPVEDGGSCGPRRSNTTMI